MLNRLNIDTNILSRRIEYYAKYLASSVNSYSIQSLFALRREIDRLAAESVDGYKDDYDFSADGVTVIEPYISFVEYLYRTIDLLIQGHRSVSPTIDAYLKNSSSRAITINYLIGRCLNNINSIATRSNYVAKKRLIISDDFSDASRIDFSSTTTDIIGGSCRLKPTSIERINNLCKAEVIDRFSGMDGPTPIVGSSSIDTIQPSLVGNGFRGNNLECVVKRPSVDGSDYYYTGSAVKQDLDNNNIVLVDPDNKMSDISNALDNDWDSSFEYEIVNISDVHKSQSCGYGLSYTYTDKDGNQVTLPWWSPIGEEPQVHYMMNSYTNSMATRDMHLYTDDNYMDYSPTVTGVPDTGFVLRLPVLITLTTPRTINSIIINTKIIGGTMASVEQAYVMDLSVVGGRWAKCDTDRGGNGEIVVIMPKPSMRVNSILLVMTQDTSYRTSVMHHFYHRIQRNAGNSVEVIKDVISPRSDDDKIVYDRVDGPGYIVLPDGSVQLPGVYQSSGDIVGPAKEVFPAWRYAIGINNIDVCRINYETNGTFVSADYVLPVYISEVELYVDHVTYRDEGADISYFISLDSGLTWDPISPVNDPNKALIPKRYIIKIDPIAAIDINRTIRIDNTTSSLAVQKQTNTIRIKAVLLNSKGAAEVSPIIKAYKLNVTGDTIDLHMPLQNLINLQSPVIEQSKYMMVTTTETYHPTTLSYVYEVNSSFTDGEDTSTSVGGTTSMTLSVSHRHILKQVVTEIPEEYDTTTLNDTLSYKASAAPYTTNRIITFSGTDYYDRNGTTVTIKQSVIDAVISDANAMLKRYYADQIQNLRTNNIDGLNTPFQYKCTVRIAIDGSRQFMTYTQTK